MVTGDTERPAPRIWLYSTSHDVFCLLALLLAEVALICLYDAGEQGCRIWHMHTEPSKPTSHRRVTYFHLEYGCLEALALLPTPEQEEELPRSELYAIQSTAFVA